MLHAAAALSSGCRSLGETGGLTSWCCAGRQVLMDQYDTNHDGQIDYPEFLAMMRAQNEELVRLLHALTCTQSAKSHLEHEEALVYPCTDTGCYAGTLVRWRLPHIFGAAPA